MVKGLRALGLQGLGYILDLLTVYMSGSRALVAGNDFPEGYCCRKTVLCFQALRLLQVTEVNML